MRVAGIRVDSHVVAVEHLGDAREQLVAGSGGAQLALLVLLLHVRLGDVAAEYVGDTAAVVLGVDEHVDLVPFVLLVAGVDHGVLQRAKQAADGRLPASGVEVEQIIAALDVGEMDDAGLEVGQLRLAVCFLYSSQYALCPCR